MDAKLLEVVRKLLWEDWDPIGVNEYSEASDEYDGYAPAVADLIQSCADEQTIFDQLWSLETGYIGLEGDVENTRRFAAKLHTLGQQWNVGRPER